MERLYVCPPETLSKNLPAGSTPTTTPSPVPPAATPPPPSPTPPTLPVDPTAAPTPEPTATPHATAGPGTWRGLVVAAEHRCSPYDSDDYRYPQSVEPRIVASMGGIIYGPYAGTWFDSTSQTDIEHIVARSEAHDSGLYAVDAATKRRFASDLLNLTLASPAVNRSQKSGKDAAEWLPDLNHCWFANPRGRGAPAVWPHHRPTRTRRAGRCPDGLHVDRNGGAAGSSSPDGTPAPLRAPLTQHITRNKREVCDSCYFSCHFRSRLFGLGPFANTLQTYELVATLQALDGWHDEGDAGQERREG